MFLYSSPSTAVSACLHQQPSRHRITVTWRTNAFDVTTGWSGDMMILWPSLLTLKLNDMVHGISTYKGNSRLNGHTRCYFIVRSKADISQLNLPQETKN